MTPQGACDFYAEHDCSAWERCSPYEFRNLTNDATLCRERQALSCVTRITAPGTNQTVLATIECARLFSAMTCDQYNDFDRWPSACIRPPGQRPDGASCVVAAQCNSGSCVNRTPTCGVCRKVSRLGEACSTELDCFNSMPCVGGACALRSRRGEACDAERACIEGLLCRHFDATTGSGTCDDGLPEGSACEILGDECDYTRRELACDEATKTCKKAASVKKIGEMCSWDAICTASGECIDGICRELPREGKACTWTPGSDECLSPARCVDGMCRLREAAACP